jgi:hypothetical protein
MVKFDCVNLYCTLVWEEQTLNLHVFTMLAG